MVAAGGHLRRAGSEQIYAGNDFCCLIRRRRCVIDRSRYCETAAGLRHNKILSGNCERSASLRSVVGGYDVRSRSRTRAPARARNGNPVVI